jgi:hypothetical protein
MSCCVCKHCTIRGLKSATRASMSTNYIHAERLADALLQMVEADKPPVDVRTIAERLGISVEYRTIEGKGEYANKSISGTYHYSKRIITINSP